MSMNRPISSWQGRRVWLVGASSGIGAACAQLLAQQGARVAVSARRAEALAQLGLPDGSLVLPVGALRAEQWQQSLGRVVAAWGGIDLVLICHADYQPTRAWELQREVAQRMVDINLGSVYTGLATVLPQLLAQQCGGIGMIASVAGYFGMPNALTYAPMKAALINLAANLYLDLAPRGLGVYLICPGFVDTRLTRSNPFSMPALQTPAQAAQAILHGLQCGKFEIHFPKRFTWLMQLLRLLPFSWRSYLLQRRVNHA